MLSRYWANVAIPHGTNGMDAVCPFCATPLVGCPGYVRLIFQDNVDWESYLYYPFWVYFTFDSRLTGSICCMITWSHVWYMSCSHLLPNLASWAQKKLHCNALTRQPIIKTDETSYVCLIRLIWNGKQDVKA